MTVCRAAPLAALVVVVLGCSGGNPDGSCSGDADCPPGAVCATERCVPGCTPEHACDGASACCSAACVDTQSDAAHCGSCDPCPLVPNGAPACALGACGVGACADGFADCDGEAADGCESELASDADNCGGCGAPCPEVAHGTRSCQAGGCGIGACDPGFGDCDPSPGDGCETDLTSSVLHCGGCEQPCLPPPHVVAACAGGGCVAVGCEAGFADCDGAQSGCELDVRSDPANCGGCGITCGSGVCQDGRCVCSRQVLLIADDGVAGTSALVTALGAAGFAVTVAPSPSYQYDGTNPAPTVFGAVVVLAGSSGAAATTDMPVGGQTALSNYVYAGNGLVLTEWAAYQVSQGRWTTLAPHVLLSRTTAFTGQVTYEVDSAFADHPIWAGLPASFTFASTTNVGLTRAANGGVRVASSPEALDAVAIRDRPRGRVVQLSHAGNYRTSFGWANPNVQTLVANAVGWAARCQ
jgi:hypothetical protein